MSAFFDDTKTDKKSAVKDFLTHIGYPYPDDLIRKDNPLWLLGVPPFSAETHLFIVDLFLELVKGSNWSELDKRIWLDRYVLDKQSKHVAKSVKRTSVWVNGHFYRSKQKLAKMVKSGGVND